MKMAAGQEISRWPAAVRAARFTNVSACFKILSALKTIITITGLLDLTVSADREQDAEASRVPLQSRTRSSVVQLLIVIIAPHRLLSHVNAFIIRYF